MTNLAQGANGQTIPAAILPTVGSSVTLTGGTSSLPLVKGLYRFHPTVNLQVGLVDPNAPLGLAGAADLTLQANQDEYFQVPNNGVVSTFGAGTLVLTLV